MFKKQLKNIYRETLDLANAPLLARIAGHPVNFLIYLEHYTRKWIWDRNTCTRTQVELATPAEDSIREAVTGGSLDYNLLFIRALNRRDIKRERDSILENPVWTRELIIEQQLIEANKRNPSWIRYPRAAIDSVRYSVLHMAIVVIMPLVVFTLLLLWIQETVTNWFVKWQRK